jgi:pimeloyl-ACP methyl ester carboxylesterase
LTARAEVRERRRFPRVAVYTKLRALLRHERTYFVADVADLSAGGMGIMARDPLDIGALVEFEFTLLDDVRPYVGRAEVAWVKIGGGNDLCPCAIGLRFLSLGHKRLDLSSFTREVVHWNTVGLQAAVDALRYARSELQGNVTDRELGQPGAGFRRPLLLIHGWLGTRGALGLVERRLKKAGFPVFSVDLGALNVREIEVSAKLVTDKVDHLVQRLGIDRIDVIGHSMGGLIGLYALKRLTLANHVRRFVAVGAPFHGTPVAFAGLPFFGWMSKSLWQMLPDSAFLQDLHRGALPSEVEIFCIVARNDLLAPVNRATLDGAHNILVAGTHAALVTTDRVFQQIRAILEGRDPFEPAKPFAAGVGGKQSARSASA